MTLTAIDSERIVYNPTVLLEQRILTEAELRVEMREKAKEGLYCPHCYQRIGEMLKVTFVSPDAKRKHFRHIEKPVSGHECNPTPESVEHLAAKAWIGQFLQRQPGVASVEIDRVWIESESGQKRKPDVLAIYRNGAREAHEIQCSAIAPETLIQRTKDLRSTGHQVIWYLKRGTYTRQIRQWLWDNRVRHFFLEFEDEMPSTREFTSPPPEQQSTTTAKGDRCTSTPDSLTRDEQREFTRQERNERENRLAECELHVGDRVTNAKGWHGQIREIKFFDPTPNNEGGIYYRVWWKERAEHQESALRQQPIIGHLPSQIWRTS